MSTPRDDLESFMKETIILSCKYIFFMLISIGLLMDDLKFCGAVLLLTIFLQSCFSAYKIYKDVK